MRKSVTLSGMSPSVSIRPLDILRIFLFGVGVCNIHVQYPSFGHSGSSPVFVLQIFLLAFPMIQKIRACSVQHVSNLRSRRLSRMHELET